MSKRLMIVLVWSVLLAGLLAACGTQVSADTPPEIRYGQDVCDRCGMIISEARFAASYVTPAGDVRRFDEISDMLLHQQDTGEEVFVYWVHDYETEEWIKAENAHFVLAPELVTPMGSGIVACSTADGAERLAAEHGGEVLTFARVREHVSARVGQHSGHGHEQGGMHGNGDGH